jgi:dihydroflavonol-4-reductase
LGLRRIEGGCSGTDVHKGQPASVAVSQDLCALRDERRAVLANGSAVIHVLFSECFRRPQGEVLLLRDGQSSSHSQAHAVHRVDGIHRCRPGRPQCFVDVVDMLFESLEIAPPEGACALRQAVGRSGPDCARTANDHVADGPGGGFKVNGSDDRECVGKQALLDKENRVSFRVEPDRAMMNGAPADLDVHGTARRERMRCLAHLDLHGAQFGPNFLILRMTPDILQIRIFGQPFEVAIAKKESALESMEGIIDALRKRVAARQVVEHQRILRTEMRQLFINAQALAITPPARVVVAQDLQRLHVGRIAPDHAFEEPDLDVEVALLLAIELLTGRTFLRHTLAAHHYTMGLGVKSVSAQFRRASQGNHHQAQFTLHSSTHKLQKSSVKCFVTGASGFIGSNLVHELQSQGHSVRALLRPGSDVRGLKGLAYERVEGDLSDVDLLARALKGCDWCFHVAASYHLWLPDYAPMYAANVQGTRNVLEAAGKAGCARIVYTSTVGCIGLPTQSHGKPTPTDESTPVSAAQMGNHYKRSKWQAEEVARALASQGLPVVIVNPSAPVGPRDVKPTPTGKVLVDFLNGAMPGYVDTGLNWVHVRDVARGHLLAAAKGRIGERYILGNAEGNWTMRETFTALSELTGKPAPKLQVPYAVALAAAYVNEGVARVTGRPPKAPLAGVRMAKYKMFFSPAKAIRELGLPQTPPREALQDAVEWFVANGYVKG